MRKLIVEAQGLDRKWIKEGDMPFNEASCTEIAKLNGRITPVHAAIALGTGSVVHIGMAHNDKRVKLEAVA